ncbi:MAG: hypothetical protein Q7S15_02100 [bacterium]|nr:hypothetical protein [bacterium]
MPFIYISSLKKRSWLIIPVGIALALVVELFALKTGRWAYNDFMPLIPLLSVGITPAIQLGLLGYTTFKLQEYFLR